MIRSQEKYQQDLFDILRNYPRRPGNSVIVG